MTSVSDWLAAEELWPARWIFVRGLGAIYLIAFIVTLNQFRPLLGERGLLPVPRFLARVPFGQAPSIFHVHYSDRFLAVIAWTGIIGSIAVVVGAPERGPVWLPLTVWLLLWVLYLSVVNVGQRFYGFGWESLLLEAGFLAAFLGADDRAPPVLVFWLLWWLLFRLEWGAGLIKLRGDPCWRDLTCLYFHHETQPLPNPLSRWFHRLPKRLHRVEVAANHVTQLGVPFLLLAPQPVRGAGAAAMVVTQGWLMVSGNFAWLNAVTLLLAATALWPGLLDAIVPVDGPDELPTMPAGHDLLVLGLTAAMVAMAWWPLRNMLSRAQQMNAGFNPLHLGNTYGAFGSITRVRHEVVIEATEDPDPGPESQWVAYEFRGKPGDPGRRSPQVAPYHLRLDWLMWFIALSRHYAAGWFPALLQRLLEADPATLRLLRHDPLEGRRPTAVRARLFEYRFTTRAERKATGDWWVRTERGLYAEPVRVRASLR